MEIQLVKRGRRLEFSTKVQVLHKVYTLKVERRLKSGELTSSEASDALMDALLRGADNFDALDAMIDRPDLNEKDELDEHLRSAEQELLQLAKAKMQELAELGKAAQQLEGELTISRVTVIEAPPRCGICRVCNEVFSLHYVAGTDDLCMAHLPKGFI